MKFFATVILAMLCFLQPSGTQAMEAKLDEGRISNSYQEQELPVWCWAASIEMAFKYYGVNNINQPTIVARTFGAVIPTTGDFIAISRNLNYAFDTQDSKRYIVSASILPVNTQPFFSGPWGVTPEAIVNHLKNGRPIIVAYQSSIYTSHAVLLSGVTYKINPLGRIEISSLTVRDPYPYNQQHIANRGKINYSIEEFPGLFLAIWLVDITQI